MFFRAIKEASSSPSPATSAAIAATTPSVKGSARKSRVPLPNLSDSDSSENEGTPIPTTHSQIPNTQSHITPTDRLETSDRMSKEKQKFFRLSAFNADKKRDKKPESKRTNSQLQNGNKKEIASKEPPQRSSLVTRSSKAFKAKDERTPQTTKVQTRTSVVSNKQKNPETKPKNSKLQNKPKPETDSASSSSSEQDDDDDDDEEEKQSKKSDKAQTITSSSSDCSSTDEEESSETSDSDSESSAQLSESSSRLSLNNTNLKLSTMFTSNSKKMETFGSISGLNNDKDDVWGFAAAAAAAKKKEDKPPPFAHLAKKAEEKQPKSCSENERKLEKTKPGFGQLKGLFDGLSHLFAASTRSRNQNVPNYSLSRRKRNADKEPENEKIPNSKEQETTTEGAGKVIKQVEIVCNSRRDNLDEIKLKSKQRDEIKLMESIRKAARNVASSHPLASTEESVVTAQKIQMTPSNLVKTAVNSKRHEFERRKFFKSGAGLGCSVGFTHYAMLEDARMKKRNLIAEATQTNPPLSVLPLSNNQTGKNGLRTHPLKHTSPL